jgi:hypothetical protein
MFIPLFIIVIRWAIMTDVAAIESLMAQLFKTCCLEGFHVHVLPSCDIKWAISADVAVVEAFAAAIFKTSCL